MYQWFFKLRTIGKLFLYTLSHADIYLMSHKSVGQDWKSSHTLTLRHAAGPLTLIKHSLLS